MEYLFGILVFLAVGLLFFVFLYWPVINKPVPTIPQPKQEPKGCSCNNDRPYIKQYKRYKAHQTKAVAKPVSTTEESNHA